MAAAWSDALDNLGMPSEAHIASSPLVFLSLVNFISNPSPQRGWAGSKVRAQFDQFSEILSLGK